MSSCLKSYKLKEIKKKTQKQNNNLQRVDFGKNLLFLKEFLLGSECDGDNTRGAQSRGLGKSNEFPKLESAD